MYIFCTEICIDQNGQTEKSSFQLIYVKHRSMYLSKKKSCQNSLVVNGDSRKVEILMKSIIAYFITDVNYLIILSDVYLFHLVKRASNFICFFCN